ncbi:MAG: dihydroneopterin aldolase [Bacteroidota bacterium]|jgi:dihydroneopterin aldolase|nr:MAG: dihydroneopterin aldolase [Bacteroidota bacterium]
MTGRVALEGLAFHAYHGVYSHERDTGNNFQVDIAVETDFSQAALRDDLEGTVDYETLYRIVKDQMAQPSRLIETVAERIVNQVMEELPSVIQVELTISKLHPPIGGECARAKVSIVRKR